MCSPAIFITWSDLAKKSYGRIRLHIIALRRRHKVLRQCLKFESGKDEKGGQEWNKPQAGALGEFVWKHSLRSTLTMANTTLIGL